MSIKAILDGLESHIAKSQRRRMARKVWSLAGLISVDNGADESLKIREQLDKWAKKNNIDYNIS